MMKIFFCGYNGFDTLQRVNKLSQPHHDDPKLGSLSVDLEEGGENADITSNKRMHVLKPEEILVQHEEGGIWTCSATLKEVTLVKSSGKDESFNDVFLSSLKVEDGIGKFVSMCTVRDKIVTIFDDRVYLNNDEFLVGERIYTMNSSVSHIGGTDSTLVLVEGKKLTLIKIALALSPAIELPLDVAVTVVSCGKEHTLLMTSQGAVYSLGGGSRGQLGLCDMENRDQPCLVEELAGVRITRIAAGGWHSTAVSDLGDLYVWGWNESGQLGLPCRTVSTQRPPPEKEQNYQRASPEADNKSGAWFTPVYLDKTESDLCQVYIQRVGPVQLQPQPTVLDLGDDICVVKVACGSRHSAVVTADGQLLTSGWNDYGQLCHDDMWSRDYFQTVDYFLQHNLTISECQKQYSKLRLTPEVPSHTSALPFLFPRSYTTSKIELKPAYARSSPSAYARSSPTVLSRQNTKLSWQLKASDGKPNDSLDSDNAQLSEKNAESVADEDSNDMNPIKLSEYLRDSGYGDPIMLTWSAKEHLSKFNLPKGRRARKLPSNPSQREKIKGKARLDYEMANMRAVAFCERQAPKMFRTASAHMRDRDVQFVEEEEKENIQREVELDSDDTDSVIVMKIDREELLQRINTWMDDVTKSLAS